MTEKRFINDVSEILDTYFGYRGTEEPSEREIKEKDYLLIGVARSQRDAENICEKLNEQNEELISYCNFSLHDLLDKKNNEIEQLKEQNQRLSEQKHIYKQDWKHLCIDKELLDSENEALKEDNAILKQALTRLVEAFNDHISDKSPVRDLIK